MSFSGDAAFRVQGVTVPCSSCSGIIHVPDLAFAGNFSIPALNEVAVEKELRDLLSACESKNLLYFLVTLIGGLDQKQSLAFTIQVNDMTTALLTRKRNGEDVPLEPHDLLFLLQSNLESKAFYSTWRNFVSILSGRRVAPQPWDSSKNEFSSRRKDGKILLSTRRIVENLHSDLQKLGYSSLAKEFLHTHDGLGALLRNSAAHAAFLCPCDQTGGFWLFGEYRQNDSGGLSVEEHLLSHADLTEYFRRFMKLRLLMDRVLASTRNAFDGKSFSFEADHQLNPGTRLRCSYDGRSVKIASPNGPLW